MPGAATNPVHMPAPMIPNGQSMVPVYPQPMPISNTADLPEQVQ